MVALHLVSFVCTTFTFRDPAQWNRTAINLIILAAANSYPAISCLCLIVYPCPVCVECVRSFVNPNCPNWQIQEAEAILLHGQSSTKTWKLWKLFRIMLKPGPPGTFKSSRMMWLDVTGSFHKTYKTIPTHVNHRRLPDIAANTAKHCFLCDLPASAWRKPPPDRVAPRDGHRAIAGNFGRFSYAKRSVDIRRVPPGIVIDAV